VSFLYRIRVNSSVRPSGLHSRLASIGARWFSIIVTRISFSHLKRCPCLSDRQDTIENPTSQRIEAILGALFVGQALKYLLKHWRALFEEAFVRFVEQFLPNQFINILMQIQDCEDNGESYFDQSAWMSVRERQFIRSVQLFSLAYCVDTNLF